MVTLVILDGFGEKKEKFGNAINSQGTPYLDKLKKEYPHTLLNASGEWVGLSEGDDGNSEVGHMTIGAGRMILQDLRLIDSEISNGKFFQNPALLKALAHAEKNKSNLHIMGILSDGRIHQDVAHMYAILEMAKNFDIKNIYVHAFPDGRDCPIKSVEKYVKEFNEKTKGSNAKIGTMLGRVYLDRELKFERVQKMYDLMVSGKGKKFDSVQEAIDWNYQNGLTDEYFEASVIDENAKVKDNDSLIFFNYRTDREREITWAFTDPNFKHFKTKKLKNFLFTQMTQYAENLSHLNTAYPPKTIEDNLTAILSKAGKTQYHVAETTKYMHVTYFFNGTIDTPYKGEDRKLIDTINTDDYAQFPKMRAIEITQDVLEAIASNKYDFIVVNYSNPDMIGHTGNWNATKEAIECVDKQAYAVALATLMAGGDCIITADHGNAEEMMDKNGNKLTKHTNNPVPCIFVSRNHPEVKRLKKGKSLTAIAPSVLKLMNLEVPENYDEPLF